MLQFFLHSFGGRITTLRHRAGCGTRPIRHTLRSRSFSSMKPRRSRRVRCGRVVSRHGLNLAHISGWNPARGDKIWRGDLPTPTLPHALAENRPSQRERARVLGVALYQPRSPTTFRLGILHTPLGGRGAGAGHDRSGTIRHSTLHARSQLLSAHHSPMRRVVESRHARLRGRVGQKEQPHWGWAKLKAGRPGCADLGWPTDYLALSIAPQTGKLLRSDVRF
jgi:hypothetical protein